MATPEEQIAKLTERLAKIKARQMLKENAEKTRARKAANKERGLLSKTAREADAHRKILLGGLVIASGVDDWNEGEIVGALLLARERLAQDGALRVRLKDKGIAHLEARKAARTK